MVKTYEDTKGKVFSTHAEAAASNVKMNTNPFKSAVSKTKVPQEDPQIANIRQELETAQKQITDMQTKASESAKKEGAKDAQNAQVKQLQDYLVQHGYLTADQVAGGEGVYGPRTTAATANMLSELGISLPKGQQQKAAENIALQYQQAFKSLKTSGEAPSTASTGLGAVQGAVQGQTSSDPVFGAMANAMTPTMNALTQVLNNINNPALTGMSLQKEYNKLREQYNLPEMQSELVNMQNVMRGTEDDIRDEITKAGGTATDSQVMALTASRNKVILKQYNALATNYEAASTNVENMMKYTSDDKSLVLQRENMTASIAHTMASIQTQMMTMGMTMQQHSSDNLNKIVTQVGYQGLAEQSKDNPQMLRNYEKLLGLAPGALSDNGSLSQLETFRQKQLAMAQQKINISIGGSSLGSAGFSYTNPTDPSAPSGGSLLQATGLSIQAFNYLTQGVASMSRLNPAQRNAIMSEATTWLNRNGVDISTFQSRYEAYNKVLQGNIQRTNAAQIQENELQGTIDNLATTIKQGDFSHLQAANVAKLFAGKQVNDPMVMKYRTYLLSLRNELAGYNAAVRGNISASGGPSPDQSDLIEAGEVLQSGIASGSLTGFQQAITSQQEKMSVVLQGSVDSANKQVWTLFGVGNKYVTPVQQSAKSGMSDKDFVDSTLQKSGSSYNDVLSKVPEGKIGVIQNSTGQIGYIDSSEFEPSLYTKL